MRRPRSLRARLAIAFALALVSALVVFAVIVLLLVDTLQWRDLDTQLATMAHADRAIVNRIGGRISIDQGDRAQFRNIATARVASALFTADGRRLISSALVVPPAIVSGARAATQRRYATIGIDGERVRVLFVPIVDAGERLGAVAVWGDVEQIDRLDHAVAVAFAFAIPVLVALATLAASMMARRGLAPLDRIVALASEIEAHDLSRRLALPQRDDELGRLASTFDRMLDRLERGFERQRRFTSDASHELRAPLAVILAEADLALMSERDPERYRRALETITLEAGGLEQLTERLLRAARAEATTPPAVEIVELDELADAVIARLRILADARRIVFERAADPSVAVLADREELESALLTVVHNAVKHALTGGTIAVRVALAGDDATVSVVDDGPGFSDRALMHAFERFWRDGNGKAASGNGLGLAIARALLTRNGGTIAIANVPGGGAVVTLRFRAHWLGASSS